jgi:hypothetical protein
MKRASNSFKMPYGSGKAEGIAKGCPDLIDRVIAVERE